MNNNVLIITTIKVKLSWKLLFWHQFIASSQVSIHDWIILRFCVIWKRSIRVPTCKLLLIFQCGIGRIINDGIGYFLLVCLVFNSNLDVSLVSSYVFCVNFSLIWRVAINSWRNSSGKVPTDGVQAPGVVTFVTSSVFISLEKIKVVFFSGAAGVLSSS